MPDLVLPNCALTSLELPLSAAGSFRLCAGQVAGIDAAIHTMSYLFNDDASEAILLVDANNAFNLLNRQAALQNIRHLCPSISTILINTYREHTDLYVDGTTILSQEGNIIFCRLNDSELDRKYALAGMRR